MPVMQITKLLPQPSDLLILYGLSVIQINRPLPQAVLTRAEGKHPPAGAANLLADAI
jgi:hypothetical protein